MTNSYLPEDWPINANVSDENKQHVGWGLGIGLIIDEKGEVIGARSVLRGILTKKKKVFDML